MNYARLSALKRIESLASGTYHRVSCRLQDIDHVLQLHVPRIYLHRSARSRVSPHVETWLYSLKATMYLADPSEMASGL